MASCSASGTICAQSYHNVSLGTSTIRGRRHSSIDSRSGLSMPRLAPVGISIDNYPIVSQRVETIGQRTQGVEPRCTRESLHYFVVPQSLRVADENLCHSHSRSWLESGEPTRYAWAKRDCHQSSRLFRTNRGIARCQSVAIAITRYRDDDTKRRTWCPAKPPIG